MAVYKISATLRNAMLQAIVDALSAGSGAGRLKFYTGSMPANLGAVTTQTLLGTLTLSDPAGTPASGALTFDTIVQDSSADATGTAAWARLTDSDGTALMDLDVTDTAGSGSVKLNTVSIVSGGPILVSSFVITAGGA